MKYFTLTVFALLSTLCFAQAPDTLWTKTYGGDSNDRGSSVQGTKDGGYIIAGSTNSFGAGGYDVYLIKTDVNGDTLWTKTYGGLNNDVAYSMQLTFDNGYVIAGYTSSFGVGDGDVWLLKTDSLGDVLWTRTYGGYYYDTGLSIDLTADSGYVVTGYTCSFTTNVDSPDVYLIKTDSLGDTLWTKTYGEAGWDDRGYSVQQTSDGGYIIAGWTVSLGVSGLKVYVIKTDSIGDTLWTRTYGDGASNQGNDIRQTADGGYVITGGTKPELYYPTFIYFFKIDAGGDTIWTKKYPIGAPDVNGIGNSVLQTIDSGYVVAGSTWRGPPHIISGDIYLIRTDANGNTLWKNAYGPAMLEYGSSIQQTADQGYVIAGGVSYDGGDTHDVYLLRLASETGVVEEEQKPIKKHAYFSTIINGPLLLPEGTKCRVFDIAGKIVTPDKMRPGIYFIEIDGQIIQKVVKIK